MANPGMTSAGWVAKELDAIKAEIGAGYQAIHGENFDLDADSPNGEMIAVDSGAAGEVWDAAGEVTTLLNPSNALGVVLSFLVQLNGLKRKDGFKTTGALAVFTDPFSSIPAGTIVATDPGGDQFQFLGEVNTGGTGISVVTIEALEEGPIPALMDTVTVIVTPQTGLNTVNNTMDLDVGQFEETDAVLRRRREESTEKGATGNLEATAANIRALDGVLAAKIINNTTAAPDGLGTAANSYQCVVDGGNGVEIAQAIWDKGTLGIATSGTSFDDATDSEGETQTINYSRPVEVDIHVEVDITTDSDFPSGGDELIKQAIVDWSQGVLFDDDGIPISEPLGIGADVPFSRIYDAINTIPGFTVDTNGLLVDIIAVPVGESNIVIAANAISRWDIANIDVVL